MAVQPGSELSSNVIGRGPADLSAGSFYALGFSEPTCVEATCNVWSIA
jgi:hypothetical protein